MIKRHLLLILTFILISEVVVGSGEWPMFRYDLKHNAYTSTVSNINVSDFVLLWKYKTGASVRSSPAVVDINNDSLLEVVIGSDDSRLYVFSDKGTLLWNFTTYGKIRSSPAIMDIDLDGVPEIVFGSDDGYLYTLNNNGSLIWKFKTNGSIESSPTIVNLDDTPEPEIIFGSDDGKIYVLNAYGEKKWEYETAEGIRSSAAVADINGDGSKEIIIGSDENILYVMTSPPYKVWMYLADGDIISSPAIYGNNIIFGSTDNRIYSVQIVAYTGAERFRRCTPSGCTREGLPYTRLSLNWNYTTNYEVISSPAIADLDRDGKMDVVIGSSDHMLYIINTSSGEKLKRYSTNKPITSSPAIGDLDSDGIPDIVFGSNDNRLYVIDYRGIAKWIYETNGSIESSPALSDLGGIGALDITVGSDDGYVYVFGSWIGHKRYDADRYYALAESSYNKSNISNTEEYAKKALDIYQEINNSNGIIKVNHLLKRLEADSYYTEAEKFYNLGVFSNASDLLSKAVNIYSWVGYTLGISKSNILLERIRADTYFLEAEYYYDLNLFENASSLAKAARTVYVRINYTKGIANVDNFLNKSAQHAIAEKFYIDALNAYYSQGYSTTIINNLKNARNIYSIINNSGGISKVEYLMTRIEADLYYSEAEGYYNLSKFDNSSELAAKAKEMYTKINYSTGISLSEILYNKSLTIAEAESLYGDAERYYTATDFRSALEYATKARDIYNSSGISEGVIKAEEIIKKSSERLESEKEYIKSPIAWVIAIGFILLIAGIYIRGQRRIKRRMLLSIGTGKTIKPICKKTKGSGRPLPYELVWEIKVRFLKLIEKAQKDIDKLKMPKDKI